MKQLAILMVFGLTASTALAQDLNFRTLQPCSSVEKMFETVYADYGETPLFTGVGMQISASDNNPYMGNSIFFVNQESGTWSHIIVYSNGTACMTSNGTDFEPYSD